MPVDKRRTRYEPKQEKDIIFAKNCVEKKKEKSKINLSRHKPPLFDRLYFWLSRHFISDLRKTDGFIHFMSVYAETT